MKKHFLLLIVLLFLLSGCSQNKSEKISVNNPYEIVKGTSVLSYYDTEDNISIDGFNIVENNLQNSLQNSQDKNDNIIVNDDGAIRCITIADDTVKTFRDISVGDSIDKIEESFDHECQNWSCYMVLFADKSEQDPTDSNKEDTWIWIIYYTDGDKITLIQIYDVLYGSKLE